MSASDICSARPLGHTSRRFKTAWKTNTKKTAHISFAISPDRWRRLTRRDGLQFHSSKCASQPCRHVGFFFFFCKSFTRVSVLLGMNCHRIADAQPVSLAAGLGYWGGLFGRVSAAGWCLAVHSGITRGKLSKMSCISVFSRRPLSISLSLHLERQKQAGAAKADRYMTWEVHIESPGIYLFFKKRNKRTKELGKRGGNNGILSTGKEIQETIPGN